MNSKRDRNLYARRSVTIEPFNSWFKLLFDLNDRTWHRGLDNNRTQILAAIFVYRLLLRMIGNEVKETVRSNKFSTRFNSRTPSRNQRDALRRDTTDGRLTIDKITSKRTLRHQAIGRKNWLFLGSKDQHRAVRNLPWEDTGSKSGTSDRQNMPSGDTTEGQSLNDETPAGNRGCRDLSSSDRDCQEWMRRESNEKTAFRKQRSVKKLGSSTTSQTAPGQRACVAYRQQMTLEQRLSDIVNTWPHLPEYVRLAVESLCLEPVFCNIQVNESTEKELRSIQLDQF